MDRRVPARILSGINLSGIDDRLHPLVQARDLF